MKEGRIILASGSPRRKELLAKAGLKFEIIVSDAEEVITETLPRMVVCDLASMKAMTVAKQQKSPCIVIGADTVVAVDNEILGKPKDEEDACRMIRSLAGRAHQVYTGVCLVRWDGNKNADCCIFAERSDVYVKEMTEDEIRNYVSCGESLDKAGAYAIQGAFRPYIERYTGDYNNIVGLPVTRLLDELEKL